MSSLLLRRSESVVMEGGATWWRHFSIIPMLRDKHGGTLILTTERLLFRPAPPAPARANIEVDLESIARIGHHTLPVLPPLPWGPKLLELEVDELGILRFHVWGREEWFSQIALARLHRERATEERGGVAG